MPEGTVFFANEPVLEVTAPLLEAQLVETIVLNHVHFQSLIAGKAARCVDVAGGRTLVDFGLRRTHGGEAGLKVARSSYLAGFDSTSNVLAGPALRDPDRRHHGALLRRVLRGRGRRLRGVHERLFGREHAPDRHLRHGRGRASRGSAAQALREGGGRLGGVRLDSGDLLELSRRVRRVLDEAGLPGVTIFASGGLDENEIERLLGDGAPIDGFGVGSRLGVSADAPYLDAAYKLVAFDGRPVLKLSSGKATLPGSKQVWRRVEGGRFDGDVVALREEPGFPGMESLLQPMMKDGVRVSHDSLAHDLLALARARAAQQRAALASAQRLLDAQPYPVEISKGLAALRETVTGELRRRMASHSVGGGRK